LAEISAPVAGGTCYEDTMKSHLLPPLLALACASAGAQQTLFDDTFGQQLPRSEAQFLPLLLTRR
jgi:hypothetical protein